ncbi:protein THEM6-like [Euwallacea similis]|uniref:protein THEM6-like n=1 Tax=Euwallacea similis TaxID=1736056 RepID=UPI00344F5CAB
MLDICFFILGITGVGLLLYFLFELHYFFRSLLCVTFSRLFKKRVHILDETCITGMCISNDIDYLMDHMNNARYIRELDFAKIDFNQRTNLYNTTIAKGGSMFVGATTIRYRRFIKIFTRYHIRTKIIYWDNQNIYLEHQFITKGEFVNTIALCRIRLVNIDVEELMKELIQKLPKGVNAEAARREKPPMPLELEKWIESNQISSERLRESSNFENCQETSKV